jgi:hypothetical protein
VEAHCVAIYPAARDAEKANIYVAFSPVFMQMLTVSTVCAITLAMVLSLVIGWVVFGCIPVCHCAFVSPFLRA